MIVSDKIEQQSEAWFNLRKGRATASEFNKVITATGRISKQAQGYMRKLARECVCEDPMEFMGNKYTDWGNEHEPEARALFAELTGNTVREVGFVSRDDGAPIGCSPDGLIVDGEGAFVGGLEIKCPQVDTHVDYLLEGELPSAYKLQVHGSMAVTGLPFWYFVSYFPELNPFIIKVERDEFTERVGEALDEFIIAYAEERQRVLDAILPTSNGREESLI